MSHSLLIEAELLLYDLLAIRSKINRGLSNDHDQYVVQWNRISGLIELGL